MSRTTASGPRLSNKQETGSTETRSMGSGASPSRYPSGPRESELPENPYVTESVVGGVRSELYQRHQCEIGIAITPESLKPLVIELFAGKFGWGRGFAAESYRCIGFDILHADYHGDVPEDCELVLQDVLTLHGSQFKNADMIVASPPCQSYSYLAMPWSRSVDIVRPSGDGWEVLNSAAAKEMRAEWEHEGPDNRLFDACFRIQREACEAATMERGCANCGIYHPATTLNGCHFTPRHIPLVVENVKGAQPWVGRAAWSYGSFYLWGDVPALMPSARMLAPKRAMDDVKNGVRATRLDGMNLTNPSHGADGRKVPMNFHEYAKTGKPGRSFQSVAVEQMEGQKVGQYSDPRRNGGKGSHLTDPAENLRHLDEGVKQHGSGPEWFDTGIAKHSSGSVSRKAASAQIAIIPFELSSHIARTYKPAVAARLIA